MRRDFAFGCFLSGSDILESGARPSTTMFPSISADGRYVAFYSYASNLVSEDTNYEGDVFVHDRQTGETTLVSVASDGTQGNFESESSDISADGRYVGFHSGATDMVCGDTNLVWDIFVHDREGGPEPYCISGRVTDSSSISMA